MYSNNSMRVLHSGTIAGLCLSFTLATIGCSSQNTRAQHYFDSGKRYFDQQKYAEAAIEFQKSLKGNSQSWEPRFYLAVSEIKQGRMQDGYRDLDAVIEQQPSFVPARLDLAELLMASNRAESQMQIDQVLSLDANNARAYLLMAKFDMMDRKYADALAKCNKAIELGSESDQIWGTCGIAALGAKKSDLAENYFRHALSASSDSPANYRNLANALILQGRGQEAEPLVKRAAEKHPDNLDFQIVLADVYFRLGRTSDVDQLFSALEERSAKFPGLFLALGDFWTWHNDVSRGAKEYETANHKNHDLTAQKKLISAYLTLNRVADAKQLDDALLQQNPQDRDGIAFRGAVAVLRNDYSAGAQLLQNVLKSDPENLLANYYLGLAWMGLNQPGRAKSAFFACVKANENFLQAYLKLAELALQAGDGKAAAEYAKESVRLDPRVMNGYLLLAQADMANHNLADAEVILKKAEQLPNTSPEVDEVIGQLYFLKNDEAAANKYYRRAFDNSPQPVLTLSRYAEFETKRGDARKASEHAKEWIANVLPEPGYYEVLARLYVASHQLDAAEVACHKAMDLDSIRWYPHWLLGKIFQQREDATDALAEFDAAITHNPANSTPFVSAAELLMGQGRYDNAKPYLDKALLHNANSLDVQNALARWFGEQGQNLDVALSMAQQVKSSLPDRPVVSDTLGWIYYQKGIYGMAIDQLQFAAKSLPDRALVQYHLGMACAQSGKSTQARQALQRALKLGLMPSTLADEAERELHRLSES